MYELGVILRWVLIVALVVVGGFALYTDAIDGGLCDSCAGEAIPGVTRGLLVPAVEIPQNPLGASDSGGDASAPVATEQPEQAPAEDVAVAQEVDPNEIFVGGESHTTYDLGSAAAVGDHRVTFDDAVIPTYPLDRVELIEPDNRSGVVVPGEGYYWAGIVTADLPQLTLCAIWPDDYLLQAVMRTPSGNDVDFLDELGMISVEAGYSGEHAAFLELTGANLVEGEQLPRNTKAIQFLNVPAGSSLFIQAQDDEGLAVNTGAGLRFNCGEVPEIDSDHLVVHDLAQ